MCGAALKHADLFSAISLAAESSPMEYIRDERKGIFTTTRKTRPKPRRLSEGTRCSRETNGVQVGGWS